MMQTIMTFMFVFTYLVVKTKVTAPSEVPAILALTAAVALMACNSVGSKGGSCFNPAIAFGNILIVAVQSPNESTYNAYWWVYIFAPIAGGALAGFANKVHSQILQNKADTPI